MPRRKANAAISEESNAAATAVVDAPEGSRAESAAPPAGEFGDRAPRKEPKPIKRELLSATLGPSNASPKMHLHRAFEHMAMTFDNAPAEKHDALLDKAGWQPNDSRTRWTKEIPEGAGWQPQADAERLFKRIANEVREAQGLGKVLEMGA
jgi:hypothetical protein